LRMTMRASLGGNQVRVRISNAYGQRPLALGSVHIALRDTGPAIVASSDRELSFGGATTATIAPALSCSNRRSRPRRRSGPSLCSLVNQTGDTLRACDPCLPLVSCNGESGADSG
jgi:hypothetical protein